MATRCFSMLTIMTLVLVSTCFTDGQVSTPEGLSPVPPLAAGFDYQFQGNNTGTITCHKQSTSPLYDWISSLTLTTDSTSRLVGIRFECSQGSANRIFAGGRRGPSATDTESTAKGTYFGGGFNAASIISGGNGESTSSGGDIVSGLTISSVQACSANPQNVTSTVTGGSDKLFYNPNDPGRTLPAICGDGDKFVGFKYAIGEYFNGLQILQFAF